MITDLGLVQVMSDRRVGWVYMMGVLLSVVIIINDDKENPRGAFVVAVELLIVIEAKVALVP